MTILGIETSCDETAAGVVRKNPDGELELLSNELISQIDIHQEFGGVVPEVAARNHVEVMLPVVDKALSEAFGQATDNSEQIAVNKNSHSELVSESKASGQNQKTQIPDQVRNDNTGFWNQIDGIAVTYGPGLAGSLLVGVLTAKVLSLTKDKPLYAVNHLEGHAYANFITSEQNQLLQLPESPPEFPMLALIVSGGHTQLMLFEDHFDYELLGETGDDAAGEAFDKVAQLLGLPYPGGPAIAQAAEQGDSQKYDFPIASLENPYDFSFSGLKTSVLRHLQDLAGKDYNFPSAEIAPLLSQKQINDTAASFQKTIVETLVQATAEAYENFEPATLVIAGGVAANQQLRKQLQAEIHAKLNFAPPQLCTDNGAMIATLGCFVAEQLPPADPYALDVNPNLKM